MQPFSPYLVQMLIRSWFSLVPVTNNIVATFTNIKTLSKRTTKSADAISLHARYFLHEIFIDSDIEFQGFDYLSVRLSDVL